MKAQWGLFLTKTYLLSEVRSGGPVDLERPTGLQGSLQGGMNAGCDCDPLLVLCSKGVKIAFSIHSTPLLLPRHPGSWQQA